MAKRTAVVAGVSDYSKVQGIRDLKFSARDAVRVAKVLRDKCNFEEVHLLAHDTEASDPPSRAKLLKALQNAIAKASADDLLLFYFAGHGLEIQQKPYLVTEDTELDVVRDTAFAVEEDLNRRLAEKPNLSVIRIFDACRAPYGQDRSLIRPMSQKFQEAALGRGKGWATLSACSTGEFAYEDPDLQHGVFTHFLCDVLEDGEGNPDGLITLEWLFDRVRSSVHGFTVKSGIPQNPHALIEISGNFFIATAPPPVPVATADVTKSKFSSFSEGLNSLLSSRSEEVRKTQFTNDEHYQKAKEIVFSMAKEVLTPSVHPCFELTFHEPADNRRDARINPKVDASIRQDNLATELASRPAHIKIEFRPKELLPHATLYISIARFNFAYGLYVVGFCDNNPAHGSWRPTTPEVFGRYVLLPNVIENADRMRALIDELIGGRFFPAMLEWSQQLTSHAEQRFEPIRQDHVIRG